MAGGLDGSAMSRASSPCHHRSVSPVQSSPRLPAPTGSPRAGSASSMARYRRRGRGRVRAAIPRPENLTERHPARRPSSWCCELRKELGEAGLDAGADTIGWHLQHHHHTTAVAGHDQPDPGPGRRRHPGPVETTEVLLPPVRSRPAQRDLAVRLHPLPTHRPGTRSRLEILTWLDDHSRYALHVTAHARVTGPIVLATFRKTVATHGIPASTLTDNGMVFTTRFSGGAGGRNHLEHELRRLNITQKNCRPNHPQTHGKVERFQQTMKNWLRAQPDQPATIAELQSPARPLPRRVQPPPAAPLPTPPRHPSHRSTTPAPKPPPAATAPPTPTTASATTRSTRPAASPCASPADSATSASAEPTPEPTSSCSSTTWTSASSTPPPANSSATSPSTPTATTNPPARPPGPTKQNSPNPRNAGSAYSDVLRHHRARLAGFEPTTSQIRRLVARVAGLSTARKH